MPPRVCWFAAIAVVGSIGCSDATGTKSTTHTTPPPAADCTEPTPGPEAPGWNLVTIGQASGTGWWACGPTSVFGTNGGDVVRPLGPDWRHDSTGLTTVNAVWGSSTHDIYAVGSGIAHFNGTTWTVEYTGSNVMNAVWGTSSGDVYAAGANAVMHTTGNGQWTTVYFANFNATSISGSGTSDVWVVGNATGGATSFILHGSASGGFTPDPASTRYTPLTSVWDASATEVFAVGKGERLQYDGHQWTSQQTVDTLTQLWGSAPNAVYAITTSGAVKEYNGTTWATVAGPVGSPLTTITGAGSVVYAANGDTVITIGTGGFPTPTSAQNGLVNAVWLSGPGTGWAVGYSNGFVVQGTNGVWLPVTSVTTALLVDVWGSGPSDVYAVGSTGGTNGTIIHYDGSQWSVASSAAPNELQAVFGTTASSVWAVGVGGTIMHNTGGTWTTVTSPVTSNLNGLGGVPGASDLWAVGDSATILHYVGGTWTAVQRSMPGVLKSVWFDSPTNGWAIGPTNGDTTCYLTGQDQTVCNPGPGLFEHYDGTSWTTVAVPNNAPVAIWGTGSQFWTGGSTIQYYGTGFQGVFATSSGGAWTSDTTVDALFNPYLPSVLTSVYGSSAQDIYAVSNFGLLHYVGTGAAGSRLDLERGRTPSRRSRLQGQPQRVLHLGR
jgi:hypothetical protein